MSKHAISDGVAGTRLLDRHRHRTLQTQTQRHRQEGGIHTTDMKNPTPAMAGQGLEVARTVAHTLQGFFLNLKH